MRTAGQTTAIEISPMHVYSEIGLIIVNGVYSQVSVGRNSAIVSLLGRECTSFILFYCFTIIVVLCTLCSLEAAFGRKNWINSP